MKTLVVAISLLLSLFSSNVYALKVLQGEAVFTGGGLVTGQTVYVDYIVSDTDLAATIPSTSFVFSDLASSAGSFKGDYAGYTSSVYYYYFQIERPNVTPSAAISALSLSLTPTTIKTTGYITGVDLDTVATFDHNFGGDHEDVATVRNPVASIFDDTSIPRGQTWQFSAKISKGQESTVLFLSSMLPPTFSPASMLNSGGFWLGDLPIPFDATIPEPTSILLIGMSILGVVLKKKRA